MQLLQPNLAKILAAAAVITLAVGLLFRFAIYRHLYIGPNDPYGISDIIELLLGLVLLTVLAVSALAAVALVLRGPCENRVAASWLFLVCIAIVVLAGPLHSLAAKWAL